MYSKFTAIRHPLCQCLCFLVVPFGFNAVSSSQADGQQVLQPVTPVIQQPIRRPNQVYQSPAPQNPVIQNQNPVYQNPVYRGPTYRGRIYQGPGYYPDLGRIITQQPVPAPTFQTPATGNRTVPPVAQRVPQASQPNSQQTLDAEQAAYNAQKLVLVEKLLEKYKASTAENERALQQLEPLKQQNSELNQRLGELNRATQSYQGEIDNLKSKLSATKEPSPQAKRETQLLEASYQSAINQVKSLESERQKLTGEIENYRGQIASLKAAQEPATNSMPAENNQAELAQEKRRLSANLQALEQKNQQLGQQYSKLEGQYQDLNRQQQRTLADNHRLNNRVAEFSANNDFNTDQVTDVAAINAAPPNQFAVSTVAEPLVDVSSYETTISQLTLKNRQLSESNSDLNNENRSLSDQVASIENQRVQEASTDASVIATASLPTALPAAADATKSEGGWSILTWLIPFFAIGLGIAFFVIMKEELHRPSTQRSDIR